MQHIILPSDLTDPVLNSTLPVVSQNLYWPSWSASLLEVLCISPAEPLVGSEKTRPVFVLTVLTASLAGPPPKTMTKEWQEASNERARELNLDPITGECSQFGLFHPWDPGLNPTPLPRCPIRGLFRKGFCAIQVDSRGNRVRSSADSPECGYALYLPVIKYSFLPPMSLRSGGLSAVGWYVSHVRSLQEVYSALASFPSFSFSPSFFSCFSSDSSSSALPMLALLSTNA